MHSVLLNNDGKCATEKLKKVLYDLPSLHKLGEHEFAQLQAVQQWRMKKGYRNTPLGNGLALRQLLTELLEELKPPGAIPEGILPPAWHFYVLLKHKFWHELSNQSIASLFDIKEAAFFNKLKKSLARLCDKLIERELNAERSPIDPPRLIQLIGRDTLLQTLKRSLLAGKNIALYGLPGVGKTTLALALAHDQEVRAVFPDGVLWSALGKNPTPLDLLASWGRMLGISPPPHPATKEKWINAIRQSIGARRILLVIDDAWHSQVALDLKVGNANCAHILTTRHGNIAVDFAAPHHVHIPELTLSDGIALLKSLVSKNVQFDLDAARKLVQKVGSLPLALVLIGHYLEKQALLHKERPHIQELLQAFRQAEHYLNLIKPVSPSENQPSFEEGMPLSLQTVIGLSYDALHPQTAQTLLALSLFPPKPNSFSQEAALAIAETSVASLNELVHAGLLESAKHGRYMLHQVIADYANQKLTNSTVYEKLVDFFVAHVEAHQNHITLLDLDQQNILLSLEQAQTLSMRQAFIKGTLGFYAFMEVRGMYEQAKRHLQPVETMASSLKDTERLAHAWLYLGRIEDKQGDLKQANTYLTKGLTLAQTRGDQKLLCALYQALGEITEKEGRYDDAERYYQEALMRSLDNPHMHATLLGHLGILSKNMGDYERAEAYYEQALNKAQEKDDREKISFLLLNLGVLASHQGEKTLAESRYRESLAISQALGHHELSSRTLANLGALLTGRGAYKESRKTLQHAWDLAHKMQHRERMCHVRLNLGEVARKTRSYEEAELHFKIGLELAESIMHLWLTSAGLIERGYLFLDMAEYAKAETDFRRAGKIAEEIKAKRLRENAALGLEQARGGC